MPLRIYECKECGHIVKTLKSGTPKCAHGKIDADIDSDYFEMEEVLTAPTGKMMETNDPLMGKSRMKDQMKILKERSRNYARDYEAKDLVDFNRANGIEKSGFLKKDGKLRGKIDDK